MASSVTSESIVLHGSISAEETLAGRIEIDMSGAVPAYTGEYEVTPAVAACELECAGKRMARNVAVAPIPLSNVSNESGGRTVTIG